MFMLVQVANASQLVSCEGDRQALAIKLFLRGQTPENIVLASDSKEVQIAAEILACCSQNMRSFNEIVEGRVKKRFKRVEWFEMLKRLKRAK
ncbi:hypothetical protein RclHR1_04100016 [Rhizophagus clarus]|uniref:Uncharacterized protein n=1 Tax=Rhizophagus clarus TaxID=94130 RepID=A0A2Z6RW94_9GLOM|nr:hypothetical protein RclHR1_04100016 [Rhizophagus clarus]